MFERNRVDNCSDRAAATVQLELVDGRRLNGRILFQRTKSLSDVLNGSAQFIEFAPFDGDTAFLAKSAICALRPVVASAGKPKLVMKDTFDPHEVMGVSQGVDSRTLRAAYHELCKRYHPDRYAGAELPPEVATYLEGMARRINAAFEILSEECARAEQRVERPKAPEYRRRPAA